MYRRSGKSKRSGKSVPIIKLLNISVALIKFPKDYYTYLGPLACCCMCYSQKMTRNSISKAQYNLNCAVCLRRVIRVGWSLRPGRRTVTSGRRPATGRRCPPPTRRTSTTTTRTSWTRRSPAAWTTTAAPAPAPGRTGRPSGAAAASPPSASHSTTSAWVRDAHRRDGCREFYRELYVLCAAASNWGKNKKYKNTKIQNC